MTVIDAPRPDTASVDAVDLDVDDDVDRDVDLDVLIADVTGHLNVQHARLVRLTARALATGAWAGVHTPTRWLALRAGLSPERAKLVVGIAERADDFPHLMSAFDHGRFTLEQVAEIIKAPAWADDHVLDFAQVATVTQLRRTMRDRFFDDGDDTQPETQPTPPRDRLSFGPTGDLRWRITGELDLDTGRRVEAALTDAKDALFHDGDDTVTWADALVEIAERSLDTVPSPARRDRYRTWLHLDVTTGTATTTDGWRIPMNVRDRILCDGVVQPVWEHDGIPFSVGRTQRVVPDRLRRIIEHRDRGCRVPGCTNDRWVEIHHITHWTNGGPTDTTNLI